MTTAWVIFAVCVFVGGLFCVIDALADKNVRLRTENVLLQGRIDVLTAERDRLEQDNMRMAVSLAEAELLTGRNPRALDDDAFFAWIYGEGGRTA